MVVLDISSRSVSAVSLCARHRLPEHLYKNIMDTRDLNIVMNAVQTRERTPRRRRPICAS